MTPEQWFELLGMNSPDDLTIKIIPTTHLGVVSFHYAIYLREKCLEFSRLYFDKDTATYLATNLIGHLNRYFGKGSFYERF
jgi:hypothetical protein